MFCQNCGTQNADGVKFCNNCGAPLQSVPQETTVLNQPPVQPAQQYAPSTPAQPFAPVLPVPQNPKNNKKLGLIIGGVVGAVAIIVAVVLIVVFAGKGKDNKLTSAEKDTKPAVSDVQNTDKQDEPKKTTPTVPSKTSLSAEETAIAFLKEVLGFNFEAADKYSLVGFFTVLEKYADDNGMDLDEFLSENGMPMGSQTVKSKAEFYSAIYDVLIEDELGLTDEERSTLDELLATLKNAKIEVASKEKLDITADSVKNDIIDVIVDNDFSGILNKSNCSDYIHFNDITEAYDITLKISIEDSESDSINFYIVKYKGEWKVVLNSFNAFEDLA